MEFKARQGRKRPQVDSDPSDEEDEGREEDNLDDLYPRMWACPSSGGGGHFLMLQFLMLQLSLNCNIKKYPRNPDWLCTPEPPFLNPENGSGRDVKIHTCDDALLLIVNSTMNSYC